MRAELLTISKAVRSLQQLRPTAEEFAAFKKHLGVLIARVDEVRKTSKSGALEETEKGLLQTFLHDTFYGHLQVSNLNYRGNTGADLTIRSAKNNTLVLFECKGSTNTEEMPTKQDPMSKALVEAVVYYCFEKEVLKNDHIKHVVITNVREWYVFDAADFRAATHGNAKVRDVFNQRSKGNLDNSTTKLLHKRLKELLTESDVTLGGWYVDLWSFKKFLDRDDEEARTELLKLYRFLHPGFLLREGPGKDSNSLNKGFYNELLHIMGLREVKEAGVKRIKRMPEADRSPGMLIENAIAKMKSEGTFARLRNKENYGATEEEQLFAVGMELCITWLDRILFLKLLEAQLLRYHGGDRKYAFLAPEDNPQYDNLNTLFFDVMAKEQAEREADVRKAFAHIPYLNSTLFVPSDLEYATLRISNLRDALKVPLHTKSILIQQKLTVQELPALEYLLRFLDTYDFGSTPGEALADANRPLITASVLGLIFEKINGYKDGSFYTPGFITMYMCRETLRPAVVQRFNECFGLELSGFDALVNYCSKLHEPARIKEAEAVIDALRICDPAVGSGHFLVSALNELLAIKSELDLLTDTAGKPLHQWRVEVANDELLVTNRSSGEHFHYTVPPEKSIPPEQQRVQSALFEQKRRLIEGGLFGVDINPNSVKICRLRLWIELLKNAYYTDAKATELRTLPNIDINIKRGNSLFSRFKLTDSIEGIMQRTTYTADQYRAFVQDYKAATTPAMREGIEKILEGIEAQFNAFSQGRDTRVLRRKKLAGELDSITGGLFGGGDGYKNETARKKAQKRIAQLEKEINTVSAEIARESGGRAYGGAFEWRYAFPEVLDADGNFRGFDVVLGNPPYIRQEELGDFKDFLARNYAETFASTADLFVYFLQLGHKLLTRDGFFCYIVANKWMRAGYGKKLREWLGGHEVVQLIDFGDLPVFEEATTYPCILLTRNATPAAAHTVHALTMPTLVTDDLGGFVQANAVQLPQRELVRNDYRISSGSDNALLDKIRNAGVPLGEFLNGKVYRGVLTGLNEAFVIDKATRDRLIAEDARSAEVIKPFLVGRDLSRYEEPDYRKFLILFRRGDTKKSYGAVPEADALAALTVNYPAVMNWLKPHADKARKRGDKGDYWWELRACDYYDRFEEDKMLYPDIAPKPEFQLAKGSAYCGNTCYFIPSGDLYLLGVLNSKVFAFHYASVSTMMRGGYFRFFSQYVEAAPIPVPTQSQRVQLETLVTQRLGVAERLATDKLALEREVERIEGEIDRLVYALYGLTDEEVGLVEGKALAQAL